MTLLHNGAGYWNRFSTGKTKWKKLEHSLKTEVLIIGGGVTGLITAYMLHKHNIDFILVEGNEFAQGSSLASTGLLQYSNDLMLHELQQQIGNEPANLYYLSCYRALAAFKQIVDELQASAGDVQYHPRSSMQFCSHSHDLSKLQHEYEALQSIGLPCELWNSQQINEKFPFSKSGALITHDDAEINPYLLVLRLAQYLDQHDRLLFEHTPVSHCQLQNNGSYQATANDCSIEAHYVIHAVGYQFAQLRQDQLKLLLGRSYVIVTEPLQSLDIWYENMMLWETNRPYLYARTTSDSRIMIGGLDEPTITINQDPRSIDKHSTKLLGMLHELFPGLDARIGYQWNATFLNTRDGLPYIGAHKQEPRRLYALGYGGNGTVSSILGAQWAADYILNGNSSPNYSRLAKILSINRG